MSMIEAGNCWDTVLNSTIGGDEFENVLRYFDFPMEDIEVADNGFLADWDISNSHCLGPIPHDVAIEPPNVPDCKIDTRPPYLFPDRVSPPATQQSTKISDAPEQKKPIFQTLKPNKPIEIQSPVSVLESNAATSALPKNPPTNHGRVIPVGPRSKRARRAPANPWHFISPLSASKETTKDNNERRFRKIPAKEYSEKSMQKHPKKCTHCEVTKTPQWREGPLGPKTLCNACGVRYRSGRLYPEYRPAASPTFAPSLHSNSHKKVIEMRNKGKFPTNIFEEPPISPQAEFVPNPMGSSYLNDYIN
ncbi:hypothetical protein ABFS83_04G197400 [Erythranthe nasuta]